MQSENADNIRSDISLVCSREVESDRRERFAIRLSQQDLERRAWKRRVEMIHVNTDIVINTAARFKQMLDDLDGATEGQCLAIPAASGAGKSHLLGRLRLEPRLASFNDNSGPIRPLIHIKAPSPCTLKTLGLTLYFTLTGKELSARLTDHAIWRQVVYQLHAQFVSVIMIDEFHHALYGRTGEQQRLVAETLKNLILPDPDDPLRPPGAELRPVSLVLSGMPWFRNVLMQDTQLKDRCIFASIKPLKQSNLCLKKAKAFLSLVESKLEFTAPSRLSEADMIQRMLKASNGYTGRMMRFIKRASFRAIQSNSNCIDQVKHLGFVFEEIYELGERRNPFLVPDISKFPKLKEADFGKLTRLIGTAQAGDETQDNAA
ncbi:AAA family ATPase [Methylobacterium sp. E-066]|uniref:AAA family ATPase n=1 Tax=Methylobacterium sp. E-066 TaxID=2836584 RepID=UPI001FBBCEFC|nr:AAA family ATPase [Methylobacterium sp. E-066]MCJ2142862.1 TniB family NTP-binding protein [Methylobacterium sp. E-066]